MGSGEGLEALIEPHDPPRAEGANIPLRGGDSTCKQNHTIQVVLGLRHSEKYAFTFVHLLRCRLLCPGFFVWRSIWD